MLLLITVLSVHAWPTDWEVLTSFGSSMYDESLDQSTSVAEDAWDLVGNSTYPLGFWFADDKFLYFRMRLNSNPETLSIPFNGTWGVIIDTDNNLEDIEYEVLVSFNSLRIVANSDNGVGAWEYCEDTLIEVTDAYSEDLFFVEEVGVDFGSYKDVFLMMAISVLEGAPLEGLRNQPFRVGFGTSTMTSSTILGADSSCWRDAMGEGELSKRLSDTINYDLDSDGLNYFSELESGTLPEVADTDDDGIDDFSEVNGLTNPLNPDSDGDSLIDGDEINLYNTDPISSDSDFDGLSDSEELLYGTDPLSADTDHDDLSDYLELINGFDPNLSDSDGDEIGDYAEYACGGENPDDRDNDLIPDYIEGLIDTDSDNKPNFCDEDSDNDGILDSDEGTVDSDCDGISDYVDSEQGNCENDTLDTGKEVGGKFGGGCAVVESPISGLVLFVTLFGIFERRRFDWII